MSQELTTTQQEQITLGLAPKLAERNELVNSYKEVLKLELTEENLPKFKALRLQLVKNRTAIGNWKTKEKAFYLAGGNFVQAIYNKEIAVNKEMESKLLEGEQHFERLEAERLEKIRSERWTKLSAFVEAEPPGLSYMEDDMFNSLLLGAETTYNNKKEAERKAELERLEVERKKKLYQQRKEQLLPYWDFLESESKKIEFGNISKDSFMLILDEVKVLKEQHKAKQKAIQEENERLKAEVAERKRLAEIEAKKQAEEKAKKQAEIQAELQAKKQEAKRLEELAKAPVKEQMHAWLNSFTFDNCKVENETTANITKKFNSFLGWAKSEIEKI